MATEISGRLTGYGYSLFTSFQHYNSDEFNIALMGGQLKAMIQPWLSTFTAISTSFDAASSNANSAVTKIPAIRDKAVLALRNVCANASCVEIAASSAIADFQAQCELLSYGSGLNSA